MRRSRVPDPAGLGRGRWTSWLPVLWQAPARPPATEPFRAAAGMRPTRFLLGVLLSAKRLTVPAAVLGMLWQLGEALVPVVMGAAIDRALATGDWPQLAVWLAVLGGVFAMLSLSFRSAARLTALATELVAHRLRVTLSRAVLHADGPDARRPDGATVSLMTNDIARTATVGLTVYPVAEVVGIAVIAVSLLLIHWLLGLIVLAGAPLTVWVMGLLSGRLARDSRAYQTLLAATVGRATDLVAGYRVIKGVRAEAEASRRYQQASQETLAAAQRNVGVLGRFLAGSTTASGVFVAMVAAAAGWFAIDGLLSVGALIAAVGLAQALLPPMRMLAMNAVPAWAAARASSARVLDAITAAGATADPPPPGDPVVPVVELSFDGGCTVRVEPGELVGVLAGERAAADVAGALLHPGTETAVTVTVEGIPEPAHHLGRYRSNVVVSPQHATLFSGTVGDNLAVRPDVPLEHVVWAAACDDFVAAAGGVDGGGVDGQVGELGNRLSGGQRQRLALARALATDAPVLVLHDPTTAVDPVTEHAIASRLRELRGGRSTILIASSPAVLAVCDRVVDLRVGEPAGSGVP